MTRSLALALALLVGGLVALCWVQAWARFRKPVEEAAPVSSSSVLHSAHCGCKSGDCTAEPGECVGCCDDPKTPAMELCDCSQTPGAE